MKNFSQFLIRSFLVCLIFIHITPVGFAKTDPDTAVVNTLSKPFKGKSAEQKKLEKEAADRASNNEKVQKAVNTGKKIKEGYKKYVGKPAKKVNKFFKGKNKSIDNTPVSEVSGFTNFTVSFTPTPGDYSVVFLSSIFGVVDGVLAGSGSQVIGSMFGIFNAALLSFGGIIILYTLMVSTLNTAADGKVMGEKWSSMMIPIRSAVGLSLLMPKATGYCAMQVLVMWIVLQGIGAADSIWGAALDYLNRGGVVVQKQMNPNKSSNAGGGKVMNAAMGIVVGQVCMKALEFLYVNYRNEQLSVSNGSCATIDPTSYWYKFCNNAVPDFMDSVNISSTTHLAMGSGTIVTQNFPDFPKDGGALDVYASLNGVCGNLNWTVYKPQTNDKTLSDTEQKTIKNTRTIAIHQMYLALLNISMSIVNNSPNFNDSFKCGTAGVSGELACISVVDGNKALYDYGYPLKRNGDTGCSHRYTSGISFDNEAACTLWGTEDQATFLFNGKELADAVAAYNGIMLPTLTLDSLNGSKNLSNRYRKLRKFIDAAKNSGWIMAGAYFFQIALLNNFVSETKGGSSAPVDNDVNLQFIHLGYSDFANTLTLKADDSSGLCNTTNYPYEPFCHLVSPIDKLKSLGNLIEGNTKNSTIPIFTDTFDIDSESSYKLYNVYTYLTNANSMVLAGQKTVLNAGLDDGNNLDFNPNASVTTMSKMSFSGGKYGLAGAISSLVWNRMFVPIMNMFFSFMIPPVMMLFSMMMSPIIGMSQDIFNNALDVMRMEGVNPITSIAIMGTQFIDGVGTAWVAILFQIVVACLFPPGLILVIIVMPLITTWMGIMIGVGFSAAYYSPFLPFLIFSFACIGWFISVIEGMAAAPVVALGAIHPEGNEVFGKAEQAIMLLLNMFLRPGLMVIGYILGIALTYIGVWILNAGFNIAIYDMDHLTPIQTPTTIGNPDSWTNSSTKDVVLSDDRSKSMYGFWSNILLFYFAILAYATLYVSIVQQAFELIHSLPDKVLRWLMGGNAEDIGTNTAKSMLKDVKSEVDGASGQAAGSVAKITTGMLAKMGEKSIDVASDAASEGSSSSE